MGVRITIVGGGSRQWVPRLLSDVAGTASLKDARVLLHDIEPRRLPEVAAYGERLGLDVRTTTDRGEALDGAEYVVVTISTGGLESMAHDLAVPERHGIRQSVGDTVGPGGISRCLRNVPVFLDLAADMQARCPDALMLNITNPMTTICRAISRETSIRAVGLCHEVTHASQQLDATFTSVCGVNHLPLVTDVDERLVAMAEDGTLARTGHAVKAELLLRFGVLAAAGDRHLVEFFPGFLTEASAWGERWGVALTTVEDRRGWEAFFEAVLDEQLAATDPAQPPSGELVAPVIDSLLTGERRTMPLNLPNAGQCPDLPLDAVVESMCVVDGDGVRPGPPVSAPPLPAEYLRRVAASQELAVDAAVTGNRATVFEAMLADPLASRLDHDALVRMTDELLAATAAWLPQFA